MKNKKLFIGIYIFCLLIVFFNIFFFVKDQLFFSIEDVPKGEFIYSAMSPSGNKTAQFYRVNSPEGVAARVEVLVFDESKDEVKKNNIYWEIGKSNVTISWVDDNIITIDEAPLDLANGDTYDCRRKTSFSQKW